MKAARAISVYPSLRGWRVRRHGSTRALRLFSTTAIGKREAIAFAKSKANGAAIFIHRRDATIERKIEGK